MRLRCINNPQKIIIIIIFRKIENNQNGRNNNTTTRIEMETGTGGIAENKKREKTINEEEDNYERRRI